MRTINVRIDWYRYQRLTSKRKCSSQLVQSRAVCVHQTSRGQVPSSLPLHNPWPETPWRVGCCTLKRSYRRDLKGVKKYTYIYNIIIYKNILSNPIPSDFHTISALLLAHTTHSIEIKFEYETTFH